MDLNISEYVKERDEAVFSLNVKKMRVFIDKWGAPWMKGTNDRVLEIMMRQMILAISSSSTEQKREARQWLREHGCDDDPWHDKEDNA